ncbi:cellulose biosynthesis protein BcsQ [Vibrio crassostreae]|uniref:hypothetical protein n=2 Tax=Vibrio TaxID=662 RepID=UPI001051DA81|nr:hypothetical protein [Vibrio crassostreae]TCT64744.1 cellulose biosynthesis protein BcsQ [Vibrio crassostreae]TCT84962.1 cellulose biosynthesis protein BcsQ [Vibrio crassostreae]
MTKTKISKTIVSYYTAIKGGVGKTSHALAKAYGLIERAKVSGEKTVIVTVTCDENLSYKHLFEESSEERESYINKEYSKLDNLKIPKNVLFLTDYVDFDRKSFSTEEDIHKEMFRNIIDKNGTLIYKLNGKGYKIDHLIVDLPARHSNKTYNADCINVVHQSGDFLSEKSALNRIEELVREESELALTDRTNFNLILNTTKSAPISKAEISRIKERLLDIKNNYGYTIKLIESRYFNFDYYFRHNINFMSDIEEIEKIKEKVFEEGLSVNKSSKIKTGKEVLGKIVDAMIDQEEAAA